VDESISAKSDPDMRRTWSRGREEDQITWLLLAERDRNSHRELLTRGSRQGLPGTREHVLREAAAVEPAEI